MRLRYTLALLLVLTACGRKEPPPSPPASAPSFPVSMAWTWHPIGALAVIEGEVGEAVDLVLEGKSIRERRFAEPGPMRWEFFRPPAGETAVLRTEDGRVLARFEFSDPEASPRSRQAQAGAPFRADPPPGPIAPPARAPQPAPLPPPPSARTEAQAPSAPVAPLAGRRPFTLPSTTEAPPTPPAPALPPAQARIETRLQTTPITPLAGRKPFALPSTNEGPPPKPLPELPPARARAETWHQSSTLDPMPGRKPFTLPSTTEAPPGRPAPELPPAHARAETWLPSTPLAPLPGRKPFTLPSTTEGPTVRPAPELPPARARAETWVPNTPGAPLPGRKPFALPSTTEGPAARPTPQLPPARARAETWVPNTPGAPLPGRKPFTLPSTTEGPIARPAPELPPARAKAETWVPNTPGVPLPGRKPFTLPSTTEGPAAGPAPELPPARARAEASLRSTPILPLPSRRPLTLPGPSETAPLSSHAAAPTPILLEPVSPRPAQPIFPPGQTTAAVTWPGMGEALNLTRGPGGRKRLVLSFDGGSSAEVATEVLDLLKARGLRTTLFLTGAFIQRFPALVKRMAAEGHEIGNHTMNHPHFAPGMKRDPKWTRERVQHELLEADAALLRVAGRPMDPLWRAPYGEHTAEIRRWAEELGYRHVGWSEGADTLDWATPNERRLYRTGEAIVQRLQQRLNRDGDGIIVLMHLGSARRSSDRPTEGLGAFMDRARQEGWSFVPVGALLHDLGKPDWDPRQRLALLRSNGAQGR